MTRRTLERITPVLALALAASAIPAAAGTPPARTETAPAPEIGEVAPDFRLVDTEGKPHRLRDYTEAGNLVVLEWFNPDCPFVKKHHKKYQTMADTYAKFKDEKMVWLAVNSGAPGKQGHGRERNVKARKDYAIEYPILLDEDGAVGRLYRAKTTPHMFVISPEGTLLYRGAIDDNRSPGKLGKTNFVQVALTAVFDGGEIEKPQSKPYGCSVKYASAKKP